MKKLLTAVFCLAVAAAPAFAQGVSKDLNNGRIHAMGTADQDINNHAGGAGGAGNLQDHGGQVLTNAKVVFIFWGWSSTTTDPYISEVRAFRDSANGMVKHMGMLSQYRNSGSTNLKGAQADVFDAVPPSNTKVTDAQVQSEVNKFFGSSYDANTVYEVLIPSGYYSDDGTGAQSCGGTNLKYCAYHGAGDGTHLGANVKYSIQPYPSCSGCQGLSTWGAPQNQEHFIVHETREAITDSRGNNSYAFYDAAGYEADDKCAWGTNLKFLFSEVDGTHTYGYQMEYSNQNRACVK